ncbi:hypothetical protein RCL1_005444 [Eukaryota sp. TZLM3-RCL]
MEKYRDFSDPETGINPFLDLPVPGSGRENVFFRIIRFPDRFVTTFSRFTFALIILLWLNAANFVAKMTFLIPYGQRFVLRYCHFLSMSVLLRILGFVNIKFLSNRDQVFGQPPNLKPPHVPSHSLLIANFSSLVDPLVLSFRHSCYFAIPLVKQDNQEVNQVRFYSLSSLMLRLLFPVIPHPTPIDLSEAMRKSWSRHCPLVLFPEGIPTNNRGILKLHPFSLDLNLDFDVFIIGISYPASRFQRYPPTWPVMKKLFLVKLWHLCSQINSVRVVYDEPSNISDVLKTSYLGLLQDKLADLTGSHSLSISSDVGLKLIKYIKNQTKHKTN